MKCPDTIRQRLETRCEATDSSKEVNNNKVHYKLEFTQDIGWDWIKQQIAKVSDDEEIPIELWKINTSRTCAYEIQIRELIRRKNVSDEDQHTLTRF